MVNITKDIYCTSTQCRLSLLSSILNLIKVILALGVIVLLDKFSFDISLQIRTVLVGWLLCSVAFNGIQWIWCACATFFPESLLVRYLSLAPCFGLVIFISLNGMFGNENFAAFTLGSILYAIMIIYTHVRDFVMTNLIKYGYTSVNEKL